MGNSLVKQVKSTVSFSKKSKDKISDAQVKEAVKQAKKASSEENKSQPGDGIRSMKTSNVFRAVNFELYAKPSKPVMIFGSVAITVCVAYLMYMRMNYDKEKFYIAEREDGTLVFEEKKSRWDS